MRLRSRSGFSLIEMIVVITIITMLLGGSALGYGRYQKNARDTRRRSDLEQIRAALELFRSNTINGNYPNTAPWELFIAPYFGNVANIPKDPLGQSYTYTAKPDGCINDGIHPYCTSYNLSATLELKGTCTVDPNKPASAC